jgi:hypothetical protein
MSSETPRAGSNRPTATLSQRTTVTDKDVVRDLLSRVVRIREALVDGDVAFAYDVLSDLEHDLAGEEEFRTPVQNFACSDCGLRFRWPGQLADHRDFVHWQVAA